MTPREKRIAILALLLSAAVHAGALLPVLDRPFGQAAASLFDLPDEPAGPTRVYRVPDDAAYADDDPAPRLDDPNQAPAAEDQALRETAERLMDRVDPASWLIDQRLPEPAALDADLDPLASAGPDRPVDPGATDALDASAALINQSDPDLALPEFTGPVDHVKVPGPEEAGDGAGGGGPGGAAGGGSLAAAAVDDAIAGEAAAARPGPDAFKLDLGPDALDPPDAPDPDPTLDLGEIAQPDPPDLAAGFDDPPAPDLAAALDISDATDPSLRVYDYDLQRGFFGGKRENTEDGWFELAIETRRGARPVKPMNKDVVYVIDVSSSIGERWLKAVNAGVKAALDSLNQGDRFNIVLFSTKVMPFNPQGLVAPTDPNLKKAVQFLDGAESAGYTDVNKALAQLVRGDPGDDRVYQVIFISDGRPTSGSIGPRKIIDVFTRANDLVAGVYAVAVGDKVNLPLVGSLAYRNKGYVERPENWAKTTNVVRDLASRLEKPIVKDATINAAGVDTRRLYPKGPLDIYQGDPLRVRGRFDDDDKAISVRIVGQNRDQRIVFEQRVAFDRAVEGGRAIADAWARARANDFTTRMLTANDAERRGLEAKVDAIGDKYGLW